MNGIKLERIAEISSGMVIKRFTQDKKHFTGPEESESGRTYYQTTLKSLDDNKIYSDLFEIITAAKMINERYLLKKGDILMKLSPPFSAAVIDFDCENLIGSSHFAIIRVGFEYDPKYLSYVLNGKHVRKQLSRLIEGGALSIIKINHLNEVEIRIRDKDEQLKYAKLLSLFSKRKELKMRIMEIEDSIVDDIISDL